MIFFLLYFLVIIRLVLVGVAFGGISMLTNALLLGSYCSVSASRFLQYCSRTESNIPHRFFSLFFISGKPLSGSSLLVLEHFYASLHFRTHDLFHRNLERGKSLGSWLFPNCVLVEKITATSVFESKLIHACKYRLYKTKIIIGQNVEDRELTRYFYIAVPVCLCGERSMVALVSKLSLRFS